MFQLHDLRKSKVWQEAYREGIAKAFAQGFALGFAEGFAIGFESGFEKGKGLAQRELIRRLVAKGKSLKELAELLDVPLAQIRRAVSR